MNAQNQQSIVTKPTKAVIYTRVSGAKQVREGDGLASQENRCREYATYKDYDVVEVFSDDMSGKFERRPAMDRMLAFLRLHPRNSIVVIIDDISRFARNVQAHIKLRETLAEAGGILESPSIEFGEDSDSRLVEHMLASVAQHQREKNAEQTSNRMKGRMMNGYAVFAAPIGYKYKKTGAHGKLLTRDEPLASIIQEGLEGYASGRIASQAELKRFFESQALFPKDLPNGQIRQQKVSDIISRVVYAGYVEHLPWGITRRKGHHEPIISLSTYEAIQQRKAARPLAPARKDINRDFPLRGFVTCACCDKPMTAAWAKSRTGKRHPYYFCQTRGCDYRRKSIRRADIEGRFEDILKTLQPSQNLFEIVKAMLKQAWEMRLDQQGQQKAVIAKQIKAIDKDVSKTLDKIMGSSNKTVIAAFEKRIEELERQKTVLMEKATQSGKPKKSFAEIIEPPLSFLANPWNLYQNGSFAMKRLVVKLAFSGPLAYDHKSGYRTAQPSGIFSFLSDFHLKSEMVPPHGLEPRTY
ncbi:recombinase family protein [uncultured Roseobacter sp.]|uniref:recombinase family protein n=1 Tax=uncultured Roseobacter sp. TaxID=114847 RepID=UPI00260B70EF|nr:recombinase family protein [uncultured Roseobacter sp.]